jgi:hypothetical protein
MAKITPSRFPGEPGEKEDEGGQMIVRKKYTKSFTVIGNAALQNAGLSWEARGLLAFLYTLPDNWEIHERELLNHTANGRHVTHKALQELIDRGYVNKRQGENIWNNTHFDVDDEPHTPEEWDVITKAFITECIDHTTENDQYFTEKFNTDCANSLAENQHSLSRKSAQPCAENQHIQNTQYKIPKKIQNTKNQNKEPGAPGSSSSSDFSSSDFSLPDSSSLDSRPSRDFITPDSAPPSPPPEQVFPDMMRGTAPAVWEIIRKEWNSHNCRYTCEKIYLNLSRDQQERVRGSMATYTAEQMVGAIRKYFKEREAKPGGYEYKSFYLFVEKGMEFYAET